MVPLIHIPKEITDAAELGVHLSGYSVHRINGFTSLARQTLHIVGGWAFHASCAALALT